MTRRALVARLDSVGDVVLCGPAVRAVAAGADEVWMLCSSIGASAGRLLPGVDEVLEWDCPWITSDPPPATAARLSVLDRLLQEASPDVAVILTSFHQSPLPLALQLRLAGVARIAAASTDFGGSLLDVRLRPGEDFPEEQPEPIRALTIARAAGFDLPAGDDGRLRLVPGAPPAALEDVLAPVVVHPGAAVSSRRWPAESFAQAVRLLHDEGWQVVVTGGAREKELTGLVSGCGSVRPRPRRAHGSGHAGCGSGEGRRRRLRQHRAGTRRSGRGGPRREPLLPGRPRDPVGAVRRARRSSSATRTRRAGDRGRPCARCRGIRVSPPSHPRRSWTPATRSLGARSSRAEAPV